MGSVKSDDTQCGSPVGVAGGGCGAVEAIGSGGKEARRKKKLKKC